MPYCECNSITVTTLILLHYFQSPMQSTQQVLDVENMEEMKSLRQVTINFNLRDTFEIAL